MQGARFALSARALYMRTIFTTRSELIVCLAPLSSFGQGAVGQMSQLRRRCFYAGSWLASGCCSQRIRFNQRAMFFSFSSMTLASLLLCWLRRAGAGSGNPHLHVAQCGCPALTG